MCFIKLSKAYDVVNQHFVCAKFAGLRRFPFVVSWIKSYLNNHIFQVRSGNAVSEEVTVSSGVHQSSAIGPNLFAVIVNDLSDGLHLFCCFFVDATKLKGNTADVNLIQGVLIKTAAWSVPSSSICILEVTLLLPFHSKNSASGVFFCHSTITQRTLVF